MNEKYVEHLQGMVRIPPVSNADPSKMDFGQFEMFHQYLEEAYPAIHKKMEKKIMIGIY